jgi:methylated-DNA-protein-cysteine methyltransferase-like protein
MPGSDRLRSDADREERRLRIAGRVRAIPEGSVRTFGDIDAGAPRLVGHVLASVHDLPWHRVVRADGSLPRDV